MELTAPHPLTVYRLTEFKADASLLRHSMCQSDAMSAKTIMRPYYRRLRSTLAILDLLECKAWKTANSSFRLVNGLFFLHPQISVLAPMCVGCLACSTLLPCTNPPLCQP